MKQLFVSAVALGLAGCTTASARPAPSPSPVPAPAAAATAATQAPQPAAAAAQRNAPEGTKPFAEVTRNTTHRAGFFDTYEGAGKLFLAVPEDRLGQDFLIASQIAEGVGARGLYGGTMLDGFEGAVVALERHGDRVYLVRKTTRFTAPEGTPLAQAVDVAYGNSVLESSKIATVREDGAVLVDVHDWLVSDLSGVGERVKFAASQQPGRPGSASLDKERSHLVSVRAFPGNVNVRAKLTFRAPEGAPLPSLADGRSIPVTVAYTIAALPETPMAPRLADDRVGYFMTVRKDFSQEDDGFFVRYTNRWRLEPSGETVDGLMVPKKPITYYVDPGVPEEYRPYLMAGVEAWNAAFEQAGWKNAIRAEMLPEGADPEDLRYATLRWNTSDQPGYGAIGPSLVDPRTGEILDADMLFEANMVRGFARDWRTVVTPAAALDEMFAEREASSHAGLAAELSSQGSLLRALLAAEGLIDPTRPVPMEYVGEALKWVTMHEVGHTLGLRHNFRSSVDTPLEKLHDRSWAADRGVFSSVMDYPSVNVAGGGAPQGHFYNPSVGSYDRWAIAFGYTHDDARAAALAREAARAGHAYGTDEDSGGPGALDPTVNIYDLGADPLAWGKERAALISATWERLPAAVLADNRRHADVTDAFSTLLTQYARALAPAVKYVGGQYQFRDRVGDPGARAPFVNVPRQKQLEALEFLAERAFGPDAFRVSPQVQQQMGADRWSHWGNQNTRNGRIDFPLHEEVLGVQRGILAQLTHPLRFARIRDAEAKFGRAEVVTIPELMDHLSRSVWTEVYRGSARSIPAMRRDLQRAHLDRMTQLVVVPNDRMPADARAVARMELRQLRTRIDRALSAGGDAYTVAHLAESRARIDKALDAGLEAERAP